MLCSCTKVKEFGPMLARLDRKTYILCQISIPRMVLAMAFVTNFGGNCLLLTIFWLKMVSTHEMVCQVSLRHLCIVCGYD